MEKVPAISLDEELIKPETSNDIEKVSVFKHPIVEEPIQKFEQDAELEQKIEPLSELEIKKLEKRSAVVSNLRELIATNENQDVILFPRQIETVQKITDFIDAGGSVGYVKLPTGFGKTVIFAKLVEAFSKETDDKTIICSPTKIIANQNTETVEKVGNEEVAKQFGRHKDLHGKIISTTYASFRNKHKNDTIKKEDFDLVILDEAHRSLGEKTRVWVEQYKENSAFVLGFTASPDFHDEKKVVDLLPYEIDRVDVREAIEGGSLASLKVYLIRTQTDLSEVKITGDEYDQYELSLKINSPERNTLIVEATKDVIEREQRKGVVYCVDRKHARDIADEYIKQGVTAEYIGGDISDEEVKEIFARFDSRQTKILCNADLLIEGFNDAELDLVINAKPTLSKVDAEQRGGRALRLNPNNPEKVALVVDTIEESQDFAPILYSDIVKGADIQGVNINAKKKDEDKNSESYPYNSVLITDSELVMDITNKRKMIFENLYDKVPVGYITMDSLANGLSKNIGEVRAFIRSKQKSISGRESMFLNADGELTQFVNPELTLEAIRHFSPEFSEYTSIYEIADMYGVPTQDSFRLLTYVGAELDIPPTTIAGMVLFSKPVNIKVQKLIEQQKHTYILSEIKNEYDEKKNTEEQDRNQEYAAMHVDELTNENLDPSEILSQKEFRLFIEEIGSDALNDMIDKRSVLVVREYYFKEKTLDQVGKEFGMTGARIRQILMRGCREIRELYKRRFNNLPVKVGKNKVIYPSELKNTLHEQSLFSPENVHLTNWCENRIQILKSTIQDFEWQKKFDTYKKLSDDNTWSTIPEKNRDTLYREYRDMMEFERVCKKYGITEASSITANQLSIDKKLKFLEDTNGL